MCVYMLSYIYTELHAEFTCVCVYTYVYTQRVTRGCVKISVYAPSVHMYVCIYLCLCTKSSNIHVGVYVFTCRYSEFGCGDVRLYIPAEFTWVCVYICVCLGICLRLYTRSLRMCVYIFTYTHTASICMCINLPIVYTESTRGCVHIYL